MAEPVIASEAKQSRCWAWGSRVELARTPSRAAHDDLGCFASLAMTGEIAIRLFRRVALLGRSMSERVDGS